MRISDCSSDVCSSDLVPASLAIRQDADVACFLHIGATDQSEVVDAVFSHLGHQLVFGYVFAAHSTALYLAVLDQAQAVGLQNDSRYWNEIAQAVDENARSDEHTYELQSLMRISYAVFCLKKK